MGSKFDVCGKEKQKKKRKRKTVNCGNVYSCYGKKVWQSNVM
jgi:hypothetical protein